MFGAPVTTEIREETPGPVAPGISKVYLVTVRSTNSATCGPAALSFVPDSFHFFSVVAQPSSIGGVASGATAQLRVTVTSDPSYRLAVARRDAAPNFGQAGVTPRC